MNLQFLLIEYAQSYCKFKQKQSSAAIETLVLKMHWKIFMNTIARFDARTNSWLWVPLTIRGYILVLFNTCCERPFRFYVTTIKSGTQRGPRALMSEDDPLIRRTIPPDIDFGTGSECSSSSTSIKDRTHLAKILTNVLILV